MKQKLTSFQLYKTASYLLRWTLLVLPVSVVVGSLVALFLWLLDAATEARFQNPWLLWGLPFAGVGIYFLYKYWGKNSEAGNNLIMDEIHEPGGGVPARMAPLVLLTTIVTHLFGGSAGREGTAVQMGGSMAGLIGKKIGLKKEDIRILLMTGIAAGFGAVFGTPVTGAIFALEVLFIGRINHQALLPCFMASFLANLTCSAWGAGHTHYTISLLPNMQGAIEFASFDFSLLIKVLVGGICFGLTGLLFSQLLHFIKQTSNRFIKKTWLIPFVGGLIINGLCYAIGSFDYLGLGVTNPNPTAVSIVSSFKQDGANSMSWFWKLLFTAITIGMGFKGGEVTPLFFIGAALGNTLAILTDAPVDLMAGLGFIAVFAAATNTPIACTFMGVELFGGEHLPYYAIACFTAYYFSGRSGIYGSQRVVQSKMHNQLHANNSTIHETSNQKMKQKLKSDSDKNEPTSNAQD